MRDDTDVKVICGERRATLGVTRRPGTTSDSSVLLSHGDVYTNILPTKKGVLINLFITFRPFIYRVLSVVIKFESIK